jgi:hypothetical protein
MPDSGLRFDSGTELVARYEVVALNECGQASQIAQTHESGAIRMHPESNIGLEPGSRTHPVHTAHEKRCEKPTVNERSSWRKMPSQRQVLAVVDQRCGGVKTWVFRALKAVARVRIPSGLPDKAPSHGLFRVSSQFDYLPSGTYWVPTSER